MPWAIKWRSKNKLDGERQYLQGGSRHNPPYMFGGYKTMVFASRALARHYVKQHYGYMRGRQDLKDEPHGWKMPQVVKVNVTVEEAD